jgi:hypothetical protein
MAGAMGFCTLSKVSETCGYSKTVAGVGHLKRICKDACREAAAVHETSSSEMLGGQGADFLRDAGDDADDEDSKDSKEEEVPRRRGSGVVAGETARRKNKKRKKEEEKEQERKREKERERESERDGVELDTDTAAFSDLKPPHGCLLVLEQWCGQPLCSSWTLHSQRTAVDT